MPETMPETMQVDFYQLSHDPAEKVLPAIAQRLLDQGDRLIVLDGREGALDRLSRALWSYRPDSFLAHGRMGEGDEAVQPILLGASLPDAMMRDDARDGGDGSGEEGTGETTGIEADADADADAGADVDAPSTARSAAPNGAQHIAITDGRWRDDAMTFSRVFFFFDEGNLDHARNCWRMIKANPQANPRFWRQEGRRWVQAA